MNQKTISDIIYEECQYTDDFPIKRETANLLAQAIMNYIKKSLPTSQKAKEHNSSLTTLKRC